MKKLMFEKVWCKNFRSVSNEGLEVSLNDVPKTIVTSRSNGSGKTTLYVHALYYVLFGKSYQKGDKVGSLINSKNSKDCLVELTFTTKGNQYLVRRGQKPTVFEIHKDGVKIDEPAALSDTQAYLEGILGFDESVFQNSIVLGSDKFVPFIEMSAQSRRDYVETLMELTVISRMSDLAKTKVKELKREIDNFEHKENNIKTKISAQDRIIKSLEDTISRKNANVDDEIAKIQQEVSKYDKLIPQFESNIQLQNKNISNIGYDEAGHNKLKTQKIQAETKLSSLNSDIQKIEHMMTCKSCGQSISQEMRDNINCNNIKMKDTLEGGLTHIESLLSEFNNKFKEYSEEKQRLQEMTQGLTKLRDTIRIQNQQITRLESMKDSSEEQKELSKAKSEKIGFEEELKQVGLDSGSYIEDLNHHNILLEHLKDNGFKASIIADYVPFLVSKINKYLDSMNLLLNITMDENFNIEMNAPNRKGQTLASLSAGQVTRINLAVLLAWRDLSSSKATCDTNLLVMDEILEKLSATGVEDFFNFWEDHMGDKGINLFVITQRADEFETYFDERVEFKLIDDFSVKI